MLRQHHLFGLPVAIVPAHPTKTRGEFRSYPARWQVEEYWLERTSRQFFRAMGLTSRADLAGSIWLAALLFHQPPECLAEEQLGYVFPLYLNRRVLWRCPQAVDALWIAFQSLKAVENKLSVEAFDKAVGSTVLANKGLKRNAR